MSVMFDDVLQIGHSAAQQGVFAKTDIAKDTVIKNDGFVWIIDEPMRICSDATVGDTKRQESYAKQWSGICKQFSLPTRNLSTMIQELLPKKTHRENQGRWLEKVLKTNGWKYFGTGQHGRRIEKTMLLIYKGSKCNHSCDPSVCPTLQNVLLPTRSSLRDSNDKPQHFRHDTPESRVLSKHRDMCQKHPKELQ